MSTVVSLAFAPSLREEFEKACNKNDANVYVRHVDAHMSATMPEFFVRAYGSSVRCLARAGLIVAQGYGEDVLDLAFVDEIFVVFCEAVLSGNANIYLNALAVELKDDLHNLFFKCVWDDVAVVAWAAISYGGWKYVPTFPPKEPDLALPFSARSGDMD